MNIQNVQVQSFLEKIQAKVMRKIEDEYYCGTCEFESQEQLDQFKLVWSQKLKQQFVLQNNQQLSRGIQKPNTELVINQESNGERLRKKVKIEEKISNTIATSIEENSVDIVKSDNQSNQLSEPHYNLHEPLIEQNEEKKQVDGKNIEDEENQMWNDEIPNDNNIDYATKIGDSIKDEGEQENDMNYDFQLNSEDLEDVSDQIIDEGYFKNFENFFIGYISKEKKTKKRSKEGNKPIKSIDFSHLIGNINSQEIIISSLRANFVDCRK